MAPILQQVDSGRQLNLLQLLLVAVFALHLAEATGTVGVNYGTLASALPAPPQVAQLVLSMPQLRAVKTYTADPLILQSFANTNITVTVGIPSETIPSLAASPAAAQAWLQTNVAAFTPATKVTLLAVGNEVFTTSPHLIPQLVPAMSNLHAALVTLKLDGAIKVGTPNNLQVLEQSFPPSTGVFRGNITAEVKDLLAFLNATGGPLMLNFYPYFAYRDDPRNVSLAFALFQGELVADGLRYGSMLEAQLDAVYSAVERLGYRNVPVLVSETGWPSGGEEGVAATPANAQTYNVNLMKYIASGKGTPLRPGVVVDAFIFALFNENLKPGSLSERFFGLFNPDKTPAYSLNLTTTPPITTAPLPPPVPAPPANIYPSPPVVTPPTPPITPPAGPPLTVPAVPGPPSGTVPAGGGKTWCVAKAGAAEAEVRRAIGYACGEGGADCGAIQVGGACYNPDTLLAHASVAFNAYYQKTGRNYWNCYFDGTAVITITDPSYSECNFH